MLGRAGEAGQRCRTRARMITIDQDRDVLGLIDIQPTFMPGGELPVDDGHAILPVVNRLLSGPFDHAFATQDWHPPGHSSFASAHPGRTAFDAVDMHYGPQTLWPDHAVIGSPGAELHPLLDARRIQLVLRKGFRPGIDSYSAFRENDRATMTGLDGWLRARRMSRLFLVGLATDYCVAWSAEDAIDLGFEVVLIEDACRGIGLPAAEGGTTLDTARARLLARGVRLASSSEIA